MARFESVEPRSRTSDPTRDDGETMAQITKEAERALERLRPEEQRLIRSDRDEVVRMAVSFRTRDGLIDDTIPRTLREFGIDRRSQKERDAYRRLLTEFFLFGRKDAA